MDLHFLVIQFLALTPLLLLGMTQGEEQSGPRQPFGELRQNLSIFIGLTQIVSKPIQALLRRPGSWGARYADHQMLIGWIILIFFGPVFWATEPQEPIFCFFALITAALFVHRMAGIFGRSQRREHSRYTGTPWIRGQERKVKQLSEPLLVLACGLVTFPLNRPLGAYLCTSGVCLFLSAAWQEAADAAVIRQMRDARIEQQQMMSRLAEDQTHYPL